MKCIGMLYELWDMANPETSNYCGNITRIRSTGLET
jgi:hypothetical protein